MNFSLDAMMINGHCSFIIENKNYRYHDVPSDPFREKISKLLGIDVLLKFGSFNRVTTISIKTEVVDYAFKLLEDNKSEIEQILKDCPYYLMYELPSNININLINDDTASKYNILKLESLILDFSNDNVIAIDGTIDTKILSMIVLKYGLVQYCKHKSFYSIQKNKCYRL